MPSLQKQAPPLPNATTSWSRRLIFTQRLLAYYVLAVVVTAHVYFAVEILAPVQPPILLHMQLITWIVPGFLTLGAILLERWCPAGIRNHAPKDRLGNLAPTLVGLLVFGLWAGGYFLVGAVSASAAHHSMHSFLDDEMPFLPQTVFIYLTVYPFTLLPFLWETSLERSLRTAGAYLTVLAVSFVIMILYPVALAHPKPAGPLFTRYALQLLHGADPAWNCFPSSHCAVVMTAALALWHQGRVKGIYGFLVAMAIGASTILTRQHYVLDALAGFGLAFLVHWIFFGFEPTRKMSRSLEAHALHWAERWGRPVSSS